MQCVFLNKKGRENHILPLPQKHICFTVQKCASTTACTARLANTLLSTMHNFAEIFNRRGGSLRCSWEALQSSYNVSVINGKRGAVCTIYFIFAYLYSAHNVDCSVQPHKCGSILKNEPIPPTLPSLTEPTMCTPPRRQSDF